jgi:aryl-alcohol dehydrogenase-like predicted oxidoreductase
MRDVALGATGLRLTALGLGMWSYGDPRMADWVLDERAAEPLVRAAVEGGVRFFDTADGYWGGASEEVTGRLLGRLLPRDEYVLATKVWMPTAGGPNGWGLGRKHILRAIDGSLKRLGTDHVDLYQVHRWDPRTPIEETMEALHDVVRAGKARFIGASTMDAWQFAKAQAAAERHGWTRFASMQPHYNLLYREEEREMLPMCVDQGVGVIPWSPLARGVLTGSITRDGQRHTTRANTDTYTHAFYGSDADFAIVDRVAELAERRSLTRAQVALAWVLHQPAVSAPIFGATRPEHVAEALAAPDVTLDADEVAYLEAPYEPRAVLDP